MGLFRDKLLRTRIVFILLFLPGVYFLIHEFILSEFFSDLPPKISIQGNRCLTREEILSFIKGRSQASITSLSVSDIENKLIQHPRIRNISVSRGKKNTINLTLEEKDAVFVINTHDTLYEIDRDFTIISTDDVRDFGLIVLSGDFTPEEGIFSGAVIREFAASVTRAIKTYPGLKERISEIELRQDGNVMAYIHYPSHIRVNAGLALESQQVRKLYASLSYFEHKNIKPKTLDLRGDDAVFQ